MDYIIAGICISLPAPFVEGHFAQALAPFLVAETPTTISSAEANTTRIPAGASAETDMANFTAIETPAPAIPAGADTAHTLQLAAGTEARIPFETLASSLRPATPTGADTLRPAKTAPEVTSHQSPAQTDAAASCSCVSVPALILRPGIVAPEQADYTELSAFDFPDADADCRFGRDGEGYLFVMTPRAGGAPARFRKGYDNPVALTDITPGHNPALFRFGVWMLFNIAAAPLRAVAMHSSVIACNGVAVLFLGESGTGKSTHTRLWQEHIPGTSLLNDDSPIVCIRSEAAESAGIETAAKIGEATKVRSCDMPVPPTVFSPRALVSGSPWSGKTPCYKNKCLPIKAIVRLSQAPHNRIRRLAAIEAIGALLPSCPPAFALDDRLQDAVCATISVLLTQVPAYHLACLPDAAAAQLVYDTIFGRDLRYVEKSK